MKKKILSLILILALLLLSSCSKITPQAREDVAFAAEPAPQTKAERRTDEKTAFTGELKVHFIDVGQADCTLIELPNGEEALIDAGDTEDADTIISYVNSMNVDDIEYLILTHPHGDHIGSAAEIIKSFKVEKVYVPDVISDSSLYENMMETIENKNIPVMKAKAGMNIIDTAGLKFEVLAPSSMYYSEMNEYSIVTKLEYAETSFLFAGDAESVSELEMTRSGYDLDSDLLKVGHHGGRTSSSADFLKAVTPEISVIFSETGNSYGHPHEETLERLLTAGSEIFRTDELGTITAVSDGKSISINNKTYSGNSKETPEVQVAPPENGSSAPKASPETDQQYVGNKNSFVFHAPDCGSVSAMKESNKVFFLKRQEALDSGYQPCSRCKP